MFQSWETVTGKARLQMFLRQLQQSGMIVRVSCVLHFCVISEKKAVKSLFAASDSQNSDNGDELLGLCSGQFTDGGATWRDRPTSADVHRGLYTPDSTNNEGLLEVLSGRFTSTQASQDASRWVCWICCGGNVSKWICVAYHPETISNTLFTSQTERVYSL